MRIEEAIKQDKFGSVYQKVFINITFTHNWLKDLYKDTFKAYGLTIQQYNVLRILRGAYPDVKSAGEIKSVMIDKSPDLTRLMDRLVAKGYAERELSSTNRRKIDIKITKEGLDLLSNMEEQVDLQERQLHHLSEDEANQLSDLLDKIRG